jgi:2-haloacid dehalogenase
MAKFTGLPWDAVLSTELVRHYKPDKETLRDREPAEGDSL